VVDRGLSVSTRINYLPIVRSFLAERFDGRKVHLNALGPRMRVNSWSGMFTWSSKRAALMVTDYAGFYGGCT